MTLTAFYQYLASASAGRWYLLLSIGLLTFIWVLRLARQLSHHLHKNAHLAVLVQTQPHPAEILRPLPESFPEHRIAPLPFFLTLNAVLLSVFLVTASVLFARTPQITSPSPPIEQPLVITPDSPLVIQFDRPITLNTLAYLTPGVSGQWQFKSKNYFGLPDQLIFQPTSQLQTDTEYFVYLHDIQPLIALAPPQDYLFIFPTGNTPLAQRHSVDPPISPQPPPPDPQPIAENSEIQLTPVATPTASPSFFSLPVPLRKQHYKFTCFSAAAQMALAYYNVEIGELEFSNLIGYDSTPRSFLTNTWGNPNQFIVGTYDGSHPGGYGAHWEPVATAINKYRATEIKRQWNIPDLLSVVESGYPVMVWWVNGVWPAKDVSWKTSTGEKVYTVNGMHVEVVTGWEGDRTNPDYILTNDPWRGKRRYDQATFLNLWKWFDYTGVIVK